jgi:DNA-binding HxlR family transcriptional regulator
MTDIFSFPPDSPQCPIRWMLNRLGERWSLYVMCRLHDAGPQRFSEIAENLGAPISNRMLAATLDKLEADGLVTRALDHGMPLYRMTDLGASLMIPMRSLVEWTMANARALDAARRRFGERPLDLPPQLLEDARAPT